MRDGFVVGTWDAADLTTDLIITRMVGRDLDERFPERTNVPGEVISWCFALQIMGSA